MLLFNSCVKFHARIHAHYRNINTGQLFFLFTLYTLHDSARKYRFCDENSSCNWRSYTAVKQSLCVRERWSCNAHLRVDTKCTTRKWRTKMYVRAENCETKRCETGKCRIGKCGTNQIHFVSAVGKKHVIVWAPLFRIILCYSVLILALVVRACYCNGGSVCPSVCHTLTLVSHDYKRFAILSKPFCTTQQTMFLVSGGQISWSLVRSTMQ